MRNASKTHTKT